MQGALDPGPARRRARGIAFGALGSSLAHGLVYALLHASVTLPPIDFELQIPSHVEFGLTEASPSEALASLPPVAPSVAHAPAARPAEGDRPPSPPKPRVKRPARPADAGVAAETPRATRPSVATGPTDPALAAFAPAGAQIALRVHMARIRDSELAPDVQALLDAVPDWRLILGGSGLDPLRDLERLYLASPDLKRSSVVIAGEYIGEDDVPRRAVENLAKARGATAAWRTARGGIATAPWLNEDETPRVVALIGTRQFAITRPADLPRVLGVARALAKRRVAAAGDEQADDTGDALLGLADGEALALSVEGAQAFARGNMKGVPQRLELSVRQGEYGNLDVRIVGHFDDADTASQARAYWSAMRDRFAGQLLVALLGLRAPLADADLEVDRDELSVHTTVAPAQARTLLGFLRGALSPPPHALPANP